MTNLERISMASTEVLNELIDAQKQYPRFNSPHEGYAVIMEELDELWSLVKVKTNSHDLSAMRKEAKQVAAMAIRFMADLTA